MRTGQEPNIAELGEAIGLQRATVETYLDALTRLFLIRKLGAWTSGETRREIKNAKYHFADTGVASACLPKLFREVTGSRKESAMNAIVNAFAGQGLVLGAILLLAIYLQAKIHKLSTDLRKEMDELRKEIGKLSKRLAHVEGQLSRIAPYEVVAERPSDQERQPKGGTTANHGG
ncbi:MAG: DUF4143 domain-containing protein [Gammaproteobacteria bacterium]|nr:DUF4143 domain-containing protein [Gammaproteobacteria bacterium]MYC58938.1 DUF4143 domain-containing protein [Gammaproteobacteria bacterium]